MLLLKAIQNSAVDLGTRYLGVAIGTGITAEDINQNALITETQRVASTNTISTTTVVNDTSEHRGEFTIAGTVALTEAGVSTTTDTGGDFAARQVFAPMNFVLNDNVVFIFKFKTSG